MRALQTRNQPKGASVETVCVARCNARVVLLIDDCFNSYRLRAPANVDPFMPLKYTSQTSQARSGRPFLLSEWVKDSAAAPVESSSKILVHMYCKISAY